MWAIWAGRHAGQEIAVENVRSEEGRRFTDYAESGG
jgi:hypothetical protein